MADGPIPSVSMIKILRPRIAPLMPRLKTNRSIRDARYSPDAKVRSWYKSKRWQDLRITTFVRDNYVCQRSGVLCIGKHPAPDSPVANHKRRHKGDPVLFWDPKNIETVSKEVHDSIIQAEERADERGALA